MLEIDGLLKIKERNFQSQIYDGQYNIRESTGNYIYKNDSGFLNWIKTRCIYLKNYEEDYLMFDGGCLTQVKFNRLILNNRMLMDKENFNYVEGIKVISQPYDKKPNKLIQKIFSFGFKEIFSKND